MVVGAIAVALLLVALAISFFWEIRVQGKVETAKTRPVRPSTVKS